MSGRGGPLGARNDRSLSGRGEPPRNGRGERPRSGVASLRNTPKIPRGSNESTGSVGSGGRGGMGFAAAANWTQGNRPGNSSEADALCGARRDDKASSSYGKHSSSAESIGPGSAGDGKRRRRKQRRSSGRSHVEDEGEEDSPSVEESDGRVGGESAGNVSLCGPPATPIMRAGPNAKRWLGKDGRRKSANATDSSDTQSDGSDLYMAREPTDKEAGGDYSAAGHSSSSVMEAEGDIVAGPADLKFADERATPGCRSHISAPGVKVSKESFEPGRKQLKPKSNGFVKTPVMNSTMRL